MQELVEVKTSDVPTIYLNSLLEQEWGESLIQDYLDQQEDRPKAERTVVLPTVVGPSGLKVLFQFLEEVQTSDSTQLANGIRELPYNDPRVQVYNLLQTRGFIDEKGNGNFEKLRANNKELVLLYNTGHGHSALFYFSPEGIAYHNSTGNGWNWDPELYSYDDFMQLYSKLYDGKDLRNCSHFYQGNTQQFFGAENTCVEWCIKNFEHFYHQGVAIKPPQFALLPSRLVIAAKLPELSDRNMLGIDKESKRGEATYPVICFEAEKAAGNNQIPLTSLAAYQYFVHTDQLLIEQLHQQVPDHDADFREQLYATSWDSISRFLPKHLQQPAQTKAYYEHGFIKATYQLFLLKDLMLLRRMNGDLLTSLVSKREDDDFTIFTFCQYVNDGGIAKLKGSANAKTVAENLKRFITVNKAYPQVILFLLKRAIHAANTEMALYLIENLILAADDATLKKELNAALRLAVAKGYDARFTYAPGKAKRRRLQHVIKALLDKGANPNAPDDQYGDTALQLAVMHRDKRVIKLCLDHGADWLQKNKLGVSAQDLIESNIYNSKILTEEYLIRYYCLAEWMNYEGFTDYANYHLIRMSDAVAWNKNIAVLIDINEQVSANNAAGFVHATNEATGERSSTLNYAEILKAIKQHIESIPRKAPLFGKLGGERYKPSNEKEETIKRKVSKGDARILSVLNGDTEELKEMDNQKKYERIKLIAQHRLGEGGRFSGCFAGIEKNFYCFFKFLTRSKTAKSFYKNIVSGDFSDSEKRDAIEQCAEIAAGKNR